MKKTKLLFAFLFFSQVIFALNIENIVISPLSNNAVNVYVKTINGNSFYFNNHNYNIANNVLTVDVCYFIDVFPAVWSEENNFIIPFDTVTNSNYTIVVNVFLNNFQTSLCDFTNFQDTKTFNFSTPLTNLISLSSNQYSNFAFNISPNPTSDSVKVDFANLQQKVKISLSNALGKILHSKTYYQTDLITYTITGEAGIYFVDLENDSGQKKLVKIAKR